MSGGRCGGSPPAQGRAVRPDRPELQVPVGSCRQRQGQGLYPRICTNLHEERQLRVGSGGRCGGSPPAQGRAAGPTVQNCSGQWSVAGNVKGKGSIHEFAQISTKNGNCGLRQGGVAGEFPRTREGRRPDRPELQWPVVSGQWSVASCRQRQGLNPRICANLHEERQLRVLSGGRCGGSPPAQGRAVRPDRPKGCRKTCSSPLPKNGPWSDHDSAATRGIGIGAPILDCTRQLGVQSKMCAICGLMARGRRVEGGEPRSITNLHEETPRVYRWEGGGTCLPYEGQLAVAGEQDFFGSRLRGGLSAAPPQSLRGVRRAMCLPICRNRLGGASGLRGGEGFFLSVRRGRREFWAIRCAAWRPWVRASW